MNFWYVPEGAEDEELFGDDGMTEELEQNENKVMKDQEIDAKERRNYRKQEDMIKDRESSKVEQNLTNVNETGPVPYTAGELIGLSRSIEAIIGDALGDVTKVTNFGFSKSYDIQQTEM